MIPFLDFKQLHMELAPKLASAFERVMASGQFILGQEVESFEAEFAHYCGVRHCVGVANGLDALVLALKAMGISAGDEVIVPANTYIATWLAVSALGGRFQSSQTLPRTTSIQAALRKQSLQPRGRFCRSICTASQLTWSRLWPSPINTACTFLKTRHKRMARLIADERRAVSATLPHSAFIPVKISARWGTGAR
jgi:hypothetical protein